MNFIAGTNWTPKTVKIDVIPSGDRQYLSAQDFHKFGVSIAGWARERQFNIRLVYSVLRGERKCLRGESYRIAKELGMK